MKKMTVIKLAIVVAVLSIALVSYKSVHALIMCQGWATASYGGGSTGSGTGQCSYGYTPIPNSKIIVEMRNCSTNATVVGTAKTTFCTAKTSCSGSSNSFTRVSGQKYYSYVTYTPDRNYPNYAFIDTSACK
ncbi:MAG: hypothetical protein HYZ25_18325 [Chloroflexi bacterium]|nr:hypothetical protein [Chloroflexota bacterium]